MMWRRCLVAMLTGGLLALAGYNMGCNTDISVPTPGEGDRKPPTAENVVTPPQTFSAPELLVISRRAGKAVIVFDFADTRAFAKEASLAERREYVLAELLDGYRKHAGKVQDAGQPVRLYALRVPDRDEYRSGKFGRYEDIAVVDSTHQKLVTAGLSLADHFDNVQWQGQFKE